MDRYVYSIVRCVPEPSTGEFVNIAAIAGSPETGDWDVRQVENESHVRKLANASTIRAVHGSLADIGARIDSQFLLLEEGGEPLSAEWLHELCNESRNVVQFSPPMLILAESSAEALDVVFQHMIIDPASRQREYITKHRVISDLHIAYRRAEVSHLVQSRVSLFVGDRVNSDVDFAVTRGHVYQLCQGWSFQRTGTGIDDLSSQVKAWGYALRSLRDGEPARVFGSHDQIARVDRDVDLQILFAPPRTREQQDVFEEARQVFSELRASVHALNEADMIGARAAELVA